MRRSMYNNNPFNIPYIAENMWKGKVPEDKNTDFCREFEQFRSFDYGLRAGFLLIKHYMNDGCRTVRQLVSCIAPHQHASSDHYLLYVVQRLNETCRYYDCLGYDPEAGAFYSTVEKDWSSDSKVYFGTDGFFAFCLAVLEYESGYYTTVESLRNVANSFNLL